MKPATDPDAQIQAGRTHDPDAAADGGEDDVLRLDLPAVGEFTRLSLWMAGAVAGLSTDAHAAQARHFRRLARRVGWPVRHGRALRPGRREAVPMLADALTGTSRAAIGSVFGPPRCAVTGWSVVTGPAAWGGAVWYYRLSNPAADAVAVAFDADGQACRVVFVGMGRG